MIFSAVTEGAVGVLAAATAGATRAFWAGVGAGFPSTAPRAAAPAERRGRRPALLLEMICGLNETPISTKKSGQNQHTSSRLLSISKLEMIIQVLGGKDTERTRRAENGACWVVVGGERRQQCFAVHPLPLYEPCRSPKKPYSPLLPGRLAPRF